MAITKNPYRKLSSLRTASKEVASNKEAALTQDGKFNPRPLGSIKADGSRVAAKSGRMFNDKGQMNAYDKKEALLQATYLHQNVVSSPLAKEAMRKEAAFSREAKRRAISAAVRDASKEGFHMIGQELLAPVKEVIDFEGTARKCLRNRSLAQGEIFRLTKDIAYQTTAWVIGQDGQTPMSTVSGRYIDGTTFKITAFVDIDIAEIMQMQYDGLERAQDLARQDIERKEDKAFINAIDAASTVDNDITYFATLGTSAFEDIRYQIERNRLQVDKFLINRAEMSDAIKTMSGTIDPVSQRELLLSGVLGTYMNCQIVTSAGVNNFEVVPAGTVYAIPAPEYLGDMGIRVDLFSDSFDRYALGETKKGWALTEIIGYIIPNSRAVAKGSK